MSAIVKTGAWTPKVTLDLKTASASAFAETVNKFYKWSDAQPKPGPMTIPNGWYDVTPQMSEEFLRRNENNRPVSFRTVTKYYRVMLEGDWKPTGQALIFNVEGKGEDLQHRCWASLLGGVIFPSYIITDTPCNPDLFAYLDGAKPRNASETVYTSGLNGMSAAIAGASKLGWRYDHNALGVLKQPRMREMTNSEVLAYVRNHPKLVEVAHYLPSTHIRAMAEIGHKGVALFFAWRVCESWGVDTLDDFFTPLGSGANMEEDDPILGLRTRLQKERMKKDDLTQQHRLALLIKSFNMTMTGQKVGKSGLYVRDNEKYPTFVKPGASHT